MLHVVVVNNRCSRRHRENLHRRLLLLDLLSLKNNALIDVVAVLVLPCRGVAACSASLKVAALRSWDEGWQSVAVVGVLCALWRSFSISGDGFNVVQLVRHQ